MPRQRYVKPEIKTLTMGQILESLGPVSCGSGVPLGPGGSIAPDVYGPSGDGGLQNLN